MGYEIPRGHLSASSMSTLLRCPKKYEYRYVKGMKSPGNKALTLGSVAHKVFETYYKDALEDPERFTAKQMVEMAMDDTLPTWFSSNESFVTPMERNEIEQIVPSITENYVDNVGKFIEPIAVEQMLMFDSRCGVQVEAHLDLVRKKGGEHHIVDYKVGSTAWTPRRLVDDLQFMLYSHITGMPNVQIQNIVTSPTAKMLSSRVSYEEVDPVSKGTYNFVTGNAINIVGNDFTGENGGHIEDIIEACAKLITTGLFPPTMPDNWWCSQKWCEFWGLCRGRKT